MKKALSTTLVSILVTVLAISGIGVAVVLFNGTPPSPTAGPTPTAQATQGPDATPTKGPMPTAQITDPAEPTPTPDVQNPDATTRYRVTFHTNGGNTLSSRRVAEGHALGALPTPLKPQSIFSGWYTDNGTFEREVYATTKVASNLDLYADYIGGASPFESDENTVASVMDVTRDFSFTILSSISSLSSLEVKQAIVFEAITEQGENFDGITVTGGDGRYTVTATQGYTHGCSYSVTLASDELAFEDESSNIRTFNWTVQLGEPVLKVPLNEDLRYVPTGDISRIVQSGLSTKRLSVPLFVNTSSASDGPLSGSFHYTGALALAVGDQLAIYEGTKPADRVAGQDYSDELISYVTVTAVDAATQTVEFMAADPEEILFTPDLIPVRLSDDADGDAGNHSLTLPIEKMTYTDPADFTDFDLEDFGLGSATTIDIGDYIILYADSDALKNADSLIYVKITGVDRFGSYIVIAYADSSEEDYGSYMDISLSQELSYEDLSENLDLEEVSQELEQDVLNSGFAESAAAYLARLANVDESIRAEVCEAVGIQDFRTEVLPANAELLASAPQISVQAAISSTLKHWTGSGLRCMVSVTCVVDIGDKMMIRITGVFVEEFKVETNVASKTIKKGLKILDIQIIASIDVYSYTYLSVKVNLYAKDNTGFKDTLNITETIKNLQESVEYGTGEKSQKVQALYEMYQQIMGIEHEFFPLFSVKICELKGGIDPLHIFAYSFKTEFVVSLDADIVLGTEFEYEKATRFGFLFSLAKMSINYGKADLVDTNYRFTTYAMGTLAIRAGIKLTLAVGLFDTSLDSIGVSAEVGAYWQIWGFLYYHLEYANHVTTSEYAGGCFMEVGIYLSINFEAQAGNKLVSYSKELYGDTWPLWSAGSQYYTTDFGYDLTDQTDDILLKGTTPSYSIPSSAYVMSQMDFKTGELADQQCDASQFTFLIKNDTDKVFTVSDTGAITITPPTGTDIATATLEVTWTTAPLVFTSSPLSRTFTLVWDNLKSSYVVNFNTNGGNNLSSLGAAYRAPISLPTPVRPGYVFSGWYTDNGTFLQAFTATTMPASNSAVHAKWTPGTVGYTVRHYLKNVSDSGTTLSSTETPTGTTGSRVTPSPLSITGFTAPSAQSVLLAGDGSTVVNYTYTRNSYSLTFKPANGLADIVRNYPYGTSIIPPSLLRTGYTFNGWSAVVASTMPAEALTYTALWAKNTYTLTYDLKGGTVGSANPASFAVDSSPITLVNPTKTGYFFAGWTGTSLSVATMTVTLPTGSTENRYYTATWVSNDRTPYSAFHYREDLSGNFTILTTESLTGSAGGSTNAVAKSFDGFTAGSVVQKTITADGTTVVRIYYTRNSYLLTFDANGGTGGTETSVKFGANITPPFMTYTGHSFGGWDKAMPQTMPAAPTTFTALWSTIDYRVAFDRNSAEATGSMSDQYFTYDSSQSLTANAFARAGYTFNGWNTASDGSGTYYADGAAALNLTATNFAVVTLYARWKSTTGIGVFDAHYSAEFQAFDFFMATSTINGYAYDSSWGLADSAVGHQFTEPMVDSRYFHVLKTGDTDNPYALYLYEYDGTPVVSGTSINLYASSRIGSATNVNLTQSCKDSLLRLYGVNWAEGLAAVGEIGQLWNEGFMFSSANGFGYYFSGKEAYTFTGAILLTGHVSNPTLDQLEAVVDYAAGPLSGGGSVVLGR